MGRNTDGEKLAKKIYSLAYNRAAATLIRKHQEEFDRLLAVHKNNIRFEYETFGEVETSRVRKKHINDEERGVCEFDGEEWPCRQEKQNRRNRAARLAKK